MKIYFTKNSFFFYNFRMETYLQAIPSYFRNKLLNPHSYHDNQFMSKLGRWAWLTSFDIAALWDHTMRQISHGLFNIGLSIAIPFGWMLFTFYTPYSNRFLFISFYFLKLLILCAFSQWVIYTYCGNKKMKLRANLKNGYTFCLALWYRWSEKSSLIKFQP